MGQRFVVPQFIEEENKIFGPVTVRQFIITMIVVVTEVILFGIAGISAFFLASLIFFGAPGLIFAFVKINGQPFHIFALNVIQSTFKKPQLRVWNKDVSMDELKLEIEKNRLASKVKITPKIKKEKLTSSRLAELSLIVDTGGMYKGD
jgi:hypothetical protein